MLKKLDNSAKKNLILALLLMSIIGLYFSSVEFERSKTETMLWHSGAIKLKPLTLLFLAVFTFSSAYLISSFRKRKNR